MSVIGVPFTRRGAGGGTITLTRGRSVSAGSSCTISGRSRFSARTTAWRCSVSCTTSTRASAAAVGSGAGAAPVVEHPLDVLDAVAQPSARSAHSWSNTGSSCVHGAAVASASSPHHAARPR
ncbi:MAG: hypothetical protein U0W40_07685 [Acidimicrobiia bacterium]